MTGVQTCALPISLLSGTFAARKKNAAVVPIVMAVVVLITVFIFNGLAIF